MKKRSLTGIQPSGNVHIGNYLGMIKPALDLQQEFECFYFIADFHALTKLKDAQKMQEYTMDLVATWLALGFDKDKHFFYRQSDIPSVTEFAWYLSVFTGMGLLEKCHAFKDAKAAQKEVNHGLFAYPVLMAADILMYEPDVVPVGKDQKQHVEVTRDIAGSVNAVLGEGLIKVPEVLIREEVMTIPGLDGQKMSKSYKNEIPIFCDEKNLRKLVMTLKTDSTPLEEPKVLKDSLLGTLFSLFASTDSYMDLESRLAKGGLGWGHAKEELFVAINKELKEPRERYNKLRTDEKLLRKVLSEGAKKAVEIADANLSKFRKALGFEPKE